jgi:hypothetical protein
MLKDSTSLDVFDDFDEPPLDYSPSASGNAGQFIQQVNGL